MKPILLLDVDGVLNAFPRPPSGSFSVWKSAVCNGFPINYAPEMGERLAALDVDIWWLTTWQHQANEWIAPLFGWDELPVVPDEPRKRDLERSSFLWWKGVQAEQFLRAQWNRPLIWIDDDLGYWEAAQRKWITDRIAPSMLISPVTNTGITAEALDFMEEFVVQCVDG